MKAATKNKTGKSKPKQGKAKSNVAKKSSATDSSKAAAKNKNPDLLEHMSDVLSYSSATSTLVAPDSLSTVTATTTPSALSPAKKAAKAAGAGKKDSGKTTAAAPKQAAAATVGAPKKLKGVKNILRSKSVMKKKTWQRFVVDCSTVADDFILDVIDFEKYMKSRIKVKNKINNLGENVTFERSKQSLIINSSVHFSKRYFKYLAKRYLKKNSLRDWVRIVSTGKEGFEMRYFKIQGGDEENEPFDLNA
ncbi:60S ribosomal protein L22 [Scaptodrosophila lebanonensis]|uniref:Large ribosomal subunit protein eL22 n=1 Tax=Drosophila lebanonensis TaxID=7225 RepID=A0A6J2UGF1_DROLE|nr:60S ribosomal protein L22 [Scaptodrosophila lebanonensis]